MGAAMLTSTRGLAIIFVFWLAVILTGGYFLFLSNSTAHGIRGSGEVHALESGHEAGSIGAERQAVLIAASKRYAESHPEASPQIAAGKALAPADFLNEELSRLHAHFRVREVDGMEAEIYEVS